ncbi:Esterase [Fulvia fulva]|nr:Esterase [Fulvia fulva]KAK4633940.1 Esterase [Fulvia fulva]WPV10537.1 Esterase [Fulvia fulva]WPV26436.1 Esterase [Fulvia fulva]
MTSRLRVLCLHGFTSNGQVHAHQVRRITKALPQYDFLFPDGPHVVNVKQQMDMDTPGNQAWSDMVNTLSSSGHRAWWFARDGHWNDAEAGGFYGFSQGACFAGMLCALMQEKLSGHALRKHLPAKLSPPMAGVIFSGFRARFPQYDGLYEPGIDMPMLHVIGKQDALVRSERSEAFIRVCKNSDMLLHEGGHDIPKSDEHQARLIEFLKTHVRANDEQWIRAQASM